MAKEVTPLVWRKPECRNLDSSEELRRHSRKDGGKYLVFLREMPASKILDLLQEGRSNSHRMDSSCHYETNIRRIRHHQNRTQFLQKTVCSIGTNASVVHLLTRLSMFSIEAHKCSSCQEILLSTKICGTKAIVACAKRQASPDKATPASRLKVTSAANIHL